MKGSKIKSFRGGETTGYPEMAVDHSSLAAALTHISIHSQLFFILPISGIKVAKAK
ncbi:hypothetical protein SAMN06265218_103100 [Fodinibius sediminis]|uniref:Uncharacterized protein n=1 Tax=Fodinibius sediminis TaxID=1214077 RepID=A0A521BGN6_9BACT|nr:hypothetical protein SAMN06265218_103100 [Fodinibius sediminis]